MPKRKLSSKSKSQISNLKDACKFCKSDVDNEKEMGKFYDIKEHGLKCHYNCLLFASALAQEGKDSEGINGFLIDDIKKEIRRGGSLKCSYCKQKGATIGCAEEKCRFKFHLTCAMKNDVLLQYNGRFKAYCLSHREFQDEKKCTNDSCPYCQEGKQQVDDDGNKLDIRLTTIYAPCCLTWLHKNCIQEHAYHAGKNHIKCPLCLCVERYRAVLYTYGIQIPNREPTWEDGVAFLDQTETHSHCDAEECLCPNGRKYDESPWDIVSCDYCSSHSVHTRCADLSPDCEDWTCEVCAKVVGTENNPNEKNIPKRRVSRSTSKSPRTPNKEPRVMSNQIRGQRSIPLKKRKMGWNDKVKRELVIQEQD